MLKYDFLVVDGNGFYYRNFCAYDFLTYNGSKPGGMYGYIRNLHFALKKYNLDWRNTVNCFDKGGTKRKRAVFENYKAGRPPTEDKFFECLSDLREFLLSMGSAIAEAEGYEADEVIAFLSRNFSTEGASVLILSDDRDLFQLVKDKVHILTRNGIVDLDYLRKRYGVYSGEQFLLMKCLMGDSSDNINGFEGIGEKRAAKIVNDPEELKRYMSEDLFKRNYELMKLLDVVIPNLEFHLREEDKQKALLYLNKYSMKSLVKLLWGGD